MFEVHFANGEMLVADSQRAARDLIRQRDIDSYADHDVFPVEISEDGRFVERFHYWAELHELP